MVLYFIESFSINRPIHITDFINNLKAPSEMVKSDNVNGDEIKKFFRLTIKI